MKIGVSLPSATGRMPVARAAAAPPAPRLWIADRHRAKGEALVPDEPPVLAVEKATLLESGFDELNGVDWDKGCYMGQELTARTKYRGLVKKRLVPVIFDGPPPAPETPVMLGEKQAGELRSSLPGDDGGIGLALLRLDSMAEADETGTALKAGEVTVTPAKPSWMVD